MWQILHKMIKQQTQDSCLSDPCLRKAKNSFNANNALQCRKHTSNAAKMLTCSSRRQKLLSTILVDHNTAAHQHLIKLSTSQYAGSTIFLDMIRPPLQHLQNLCIHQCLGTMRNNCDATCIPAACLQLTSDFKANLCYFCIRPQKC